tara:strand:+ start:3816 stop:4037 length:222 start_codon:yes stop_codon:yes gene_type:complete
MTKLTHLQNYFIATCQIILLIGLIFFGIEYFLLGLGCFVMGLSFFSSVNNQPRSKGITEPYTGKSGKRIPLTR